MGNCCGKKEPWGTKIFQRRSVEADIKLDNEYATLPFVSLQTKQSFAASDTRVHLPSLNNQVERDVRVFVALFDYDARTSEDLTFKKGDYLEAGQAENTAYDWWQGKLFLQLDWLPISDRIKYLRAITVYKALHNLAPLYISSLIRPFNRVHSFKTRGSVKDSLQLAKVTSKSGQRTFAFLASSE